MTKVNVTGYRAVLLAMVKDERDHAGRVATTVGALQALARTAKTADAFLAGCKAAEDEYRAANKDASIPRAWVNAKSVIKYALENKVSIKGTYAKTQQAVTAKRKAAKAAGEAAEAGVTAENTPAAIIPQDVREALQSVGNKVIQMLTAGGDEGKARVLRILGEADKALGDILRAVLPVEPEAPAEEVEEKPKARRASRSRRAA